jgi:hypothetical protein
MNAEPQMESFYDRALSAAEVVFWICLLIYI